MMRNILLIAKNTLKVTFRKKSSILVFILLPVLAVLISIGLYSSANTGTVRIGIYDKDNGTLSNDMLEYLKNTDKFKIMYIKEDEINDKVSGREVDCVLVIPEDFEEKIYQGTVGSVEIVSIKGEDATAWIKTYTNFYIGNLIDISKASKGNKVIFNKIYEGFKEGELKYEAKMLKDISKDKYITNQGIGFLIFFIMLGATITSSIILKEKRDRTYFRICSSPVNSKEYILGNTLANLFIIFIQNIIVLTALTKIYRINTMVPSYELLVVLMSFGLVAVSIGMLIVSFSSSTSQVNSLSTLIITPTCMLGGCFIPIEMMPDIVKKIANFMPHKWTIEAINKLQSGSSFNEALVNIAVTISFAIAFFLISAYRFKSSKDIKNFV